MFDDLPSATPEKSGNDKAAANKSSEKRNRQPHEKLKPVQMETGKETPSWLRVLEGGGLIGSLVIWAEMSDCHNALALYFYFAALLSCYVGICHLVYQFFKKNKCAAKFSIVLWVALAGITMDFVWKNFRQELDSVEKHPHLGLLLVTSHAPYHPVMFNEPTLFVDSSHVSFPTNTPFLLLPMTWGETNLGLQFEIVSDGPTNSSEIEDPEVSIVLLKNSGFELMEGWSEMLPSPFSKDEFRKFQWKSPNKFLLSMDSEPLPKISFSPWAPLKTPGGIIGSIPIVIEIRARNINSFVLRFFAYAQTMPPEMTNLIFMPEIVPSSSLKFSPDGMIGFPLSTNE